MCALHASDFELLALDETFDGEIRFDEPMRRHCTYRIGGPVHIWCEVRSVAALGQAIKAIQSDAIPWIALGKGSNILVADEGYPGAIITLSGEFRQWSFEENADRVIVGAGTTLARLVQEVFHRGYSGMEFAVGTPGSVGGALYMNAGTKDDWIGSRVISVTTFSPDAGLVRHMGSDIEWGYRHTSFAPNEIIVECELQLEKAVSGNIHDKMNKLLTRRKETQPLNFPSCGSVFRNPEGHSAGALIDKVGLKGATCGGAQISEKHANFIVNKTGEASARDVMTLIERAQEKVREAYGIQLTTEVKFIGFAE